MISSGWLRLRMPKCHCERARRVGALATDDSDVWPLLLRLRKPSERWNSGRLVSSTEICEVRCR